MKKCEWKDGKFRTCDNFDGEIMTGFYSTDEENSMIIPFSQCKQCGADIRKPEPEVVIKKSGETWVAHFNGIDYLCEKPNKNGSPATFVFNSDKTVSNSGYWKPISEIEITDDIANLHCKVKVYEDNTNGLHEGTVCNLLYVEGRSCVVKDPESGIHWVGIRFVHIANIDEIG